MSSKIFVANFPFSTTSEDLQDLFGQHGEVVSAKVATDRETGRSRGFGFVEMATPAAAGRGVRGPRRPGRRGWPRRPRWRAAARQFRPAAAPPVLSLPPLPGGRASLAEPDAGRPLQRPPRPPT
mgnify:CR=1 FL=1